MPVKKRAPALPPASPEYSKEHTDRTLNTLRQYFFQIDATLNSLGSAAEADSDTYVLRANNLSDLDDAATGRINLGLGSAAVEDDDRYVHRANNLSDLANAGTARNNLGLGTAATEADTKYAHRANNLSDVTASAARSNLSVYSQAEADATFYSIGSSTNSLVIDRDNDTVYSGINWRTNSNSNWLLYLLNDGSGDFAIQTRNYTTDGSFKDTVLTVSWSTSVVDFKETPSVNGSDVAVSDTAVSFTRVNTDEVRTANGNYLIVNVGESHTVATGQTGEHLYVNSENGLQVNASPDNWGSGWAGRVTTQIGATGITWDGNDAAFLQLSQSWTARQTFQGVRETVFTVTGTSPALNPNNGTIQMWTLTGNSSPSDGFGNGDSMTLMVDDGSSYTITWPTMTWIDGSAPTLATSGWTVIVLFKVGSTLYGKY